MLGTPVRFDYTGAFQTYTVPAGVIGLIVDCVGAAGKAETTTDEYYGGSETKYGGNGGRVQCNLTVTAGTILYIYIGGKPVSLGTATYNASDIRTNNSGITNSTSLSSRLIVAGGGGSAGIGTKYSSTFYHGGAGGAGGGTTASAGANSTSSGGGGAGTQSAGGAGGSSGGLAAGKAGSFGLGGFTAASSSDMDWTSSGQGGSGWYGGGSGGLSITQYFPNVGGGGGGSSYTNPILCTEVTHTQGYSEANGNGWIILTPILPDAYERDPSADKAVIMHSKTYNAFTTAGYDEIGTLHGVYLKNIPDEYGISDAEYITVFEDQVGNTANKAHLMQYIGNKAVVDVPIGKKQG